MTSNFLLDVGILKFYSEYKVLLYFIKFEFCCNV